MRIKKPIKRSEIRSVIYTEERWKLLKELREKAISIMSILEKEQIPCIVHGSVARGDVNPDSDIDIFIPLLVPPYKVELSLERHGLEPIKREIVQATPWHVIKAHIYLDEQTVITFPLTHMTRIEREFYKFGGELTLEELKQGKRVPGVDKRLMLIYPRPYGHDEYSIIGMESEVARILGVSLDIVREREYVLLRRDEIGRTGVFIRRELAPNESFESVLEELSRKHVLVRKKLRELGLV
ncbi:MAG: DNA polymerase subunit beta [Thermoprotei archaeon]|nr:MAG: DNA polymerase subunit beta [Thermoprotei archaeon]RLF19875.1 MAG: DNA polymerase subunit beta [Thermoprotei archaeon]